MKESKSIRGLKAKKNGDYFENIFMFFANRSGFNFIKIPNGCKVLDKGKLVPVKSPFDFILCNSVYTIFVDTKTTKQNVFSFSAINQNQVLNLLKVKNENNYSGYIIDLNGEVVFFCVSKLKTIKPGESIKKEDGVYLGSIKEFDLRRIYGTT